MATRLKQGSASLGVVQSTQRLTIQEHLPPRWMGNLAGHLALKNCNLLTLEGVRSAGGMWTVKLSVSGALQLDARQLVSFALSAADFDLADPIEIESYQLTPDIGGLKLVLIGKDRIGFLASLSAALAGMVLFPSFVQVHTQGDRAMDTLQLTSLGEAPPSESTRQALDRFLQAHLRKNSTRPPSFRG